MIVRAIYHALGLLFLAWVVVVPLKFAFVSGLATFGFYTWATRPGAEERRQQRDEREQRERKEQHNAPPVIPEQERMQAEVNASSRVTLRLVERRWLRAEVTAVNATTQVIELTAVACRVLYEPDGGQRPNIVNDGYWRVRLDPGERFAGEVRFSHDDVRSRDYGLPNALAASRCLLRVKVVEEGNARPGSAINPIPMTTNGYHSENSR